MNRIFKIAGTACVAGILCLVAANWFALRYWTQRGAVIRIPPEQQVMWTGVMSTTNGWEFKLVNLFDFRKRNAGPVLFCAKTRHLFIGFARDEDDSFYQWDVDTGKCVHTFHAGKGFCQSPEAVSPDGKHLIVTRRTALMDDFKTMIMSVEKRSVIADLGDLNPSRGCRFSPDGTRVWLGTGTDVDGPVVFNLDGTRVNGVSVEVFPESQDRRIWEVPVSKSQPVAPGLYFKDPSGITHHLTKDSCFGNYWISKDSRIIVAANRHDEIVVWDADSAKEVVRQRITQDHNGGCNVIYDEAKDRFLIADRSYQGTTYLRALIVTKRPRANRQLAN